METIRILRGLGNARLIELLPLDGLKLYILLLLFVKQTDILSSIDFMTIKRALGGILSLERLERAVASLERHHLAKVFYPCGKKRFLLKKNTNFIIKYMLRAPSLRKSHPLY